MEKNIFYGLALLGIKCLFDCDFHSDFVGDFVLLQTGRRYSDSASVLFPGNVDAAALL